MKKKILSAFLVVMLTILAVILSGCGENVKKQGETSTKLTEEEMYKSVIDQYKKVVSEYDEDDYEAMERMESEYDMVNFTVALLSLHYKDNGNKIAYTFYDVDGNGIKELIVGVSSDSKDYFSEGAIYTYDQNTKQPVKLYYQTTLERGRLYIYDNGVIYSEGSGGASFHYYEFGKISEDGKALNMIEEIEEEYTEGSDIPVYRNHETNKVLNYKGLDEILEKYVSNSKTVEYGEIYVL